MLAYIYWLTRTQELLKQFIFQLTFNKGTNLVINNSLDLEHLGQLTAKVALVLLYPAHVRTLSVASASPECCARPVRELSREMRYSMRCERVMFGAHFMASRRIELPCDEKSFTVD